MIGNISSPASLNIGGEITYFNPPAVMGIVNVTPDSFYADSRVVSDSDLRRRVGEMLADGASIIDLGAYSSRPGADDLSPEVEWERLKRALATIRAEWPDIHISVDTFRADVARLCVEEYNVQIINDISGGLLDPGMWLTVADLNVAYILMHMRGTPSTMQSFTDYDDVSADVLSDLAFKLDSLHSLGIANVIIDPGFGFAKTVEQNYQILDRLDIFKSLGCPVLAGLSRKSMIYKPLGIAPEEALCGTVTLNTVAILRGADILRAHDVKAAFQSIKLLSRLKTSQSRQTTND